MRLSANYSPSVDLIKYTLYKYYAFFNYYVYRYPGAIDSNWVVDAINMYL